MTSSLSTLAPTGSTRSRATATLWLLAALAGGLIVGWLDRSATESQGPLLVLMTVAFVTAIPRRAPGWAIAIAAALGLPLAHAIGRLSGDPTGASWGMLIAVAPTMIAAYAGVGTGVVMRASSGAVGRRFLLGAVVLGCAALGYGPVYATLTARAQPFAWWVATIWQLITLVAWAAVTPALLRAWRNGHSHDDGRISSRDLLAHGGAVLTIAVAHAVVLPLVTRLLFIPLGTSSLAGTAAWAFAAYLPLDVLTYITVMGVAYLSDADRRAQTALAQEAAARGELAVARLAGLRAQLRPHFLFNALNTASVMASRGDGEGTRRVLAGLGDLLRYVMRGADDADAPAATNRGMVPLREEIAFVQQYLALERERFPERLRATITVAPEVQNVEVPALLLQPLVENAIKHGLGGRIGAGEIMVRAWRERDSLYLSVTDDGPGPQSAIPNAPTAGIGLSNTRARLAVLYGNAAEVKLGRRAEGGAEVLVIIPSRETATTAS